MTNKALSAKTLLHCFNNCFVILVIKNKVGKQM